MYQWCIPYLLCWIQIKLSFLFGFLFFTETKLYSIFWVIYCNNINLKTLQIWMKNRKSMLHLSAR